MQQQVIKLRVGDEIKVQNVSCNSAESESIVANLVNGFGLDYQTDGKWVHDNHPAGDTMWRSSQNPKEVWITFDLGNVFPLGYIDIWNYNQSAKSGNDSDFTYYGIKELILYTSIDGISWQEFISEQHPFILAKASGKEKLEPTNLEDGKPLYFKYKNARYVKFMTNPLAGKGNWGGIPGKENIFGLSAVKFYVGKGYYSQREEEWTDLFARYEGWTGADASFSIPMSGFEAPGNAAQTRTIFSFSDTLIGKIDKETFKRTGHTVMVNNTIGILKGDQPIKDSIEFIWGKNGTFSLDSVFIPQNHPQGYYYWIQDGIVINGLLHLFAMLVRSDPNQQEGFKFAVDDVDIITVPITSNGLNFESQKQYTTPLYHKNKDGGENINISNAIMSNTKESGNPNPDGYIYIYGTKNLNMSRGSVVARVNPENFLNFSKWTYYDGNGWSSEISDCVYLNKDISCEYSVSPVTNGMHKGKYILIYQVLGISNKIAYQIGDTPWGPFDEPKIIYSTPDPDKGQAIYTYNAKAHPHLSPKDKLLVSYNVNSRSDKAHHNNGHIYKTGWISLIDTTA